MRRQYRIALLALILFIGGILFDRPQEAVALRAWLSKAKSDCSSIQAAITLMYYNDDGHEHDFFSLIVYDHAKNYLTSLNESIMPNQSPFYWQTGRLGVAAYDGKYLIEVWDVDGNGVKHKLVEQVWHDCHTGDSWRESPPPAEQDPGIPKVTCKSRAPLHTTNLAPENGAIVAMWSWEPLRIDNPDYTEWHVSSFPVSKGEGFLGDKEIFAPCGTYLHLYFQPDSTKLLYSMPSQYWPHTAYGMPAEEHAQGPIYYTFFPLNGPLREGTAVPFTLPVPEGQ